MDGSFQESDCILDDYEHSDPNLFYCVTRIPGKGAPEFRYLDSGCSCPGSRCTADNGCACLKFAGANFRSTDRGLVLENDKFGHVPVFECNIRCSCFENFKNVNKTNCRISNLCPNRNVQFGPVDGLEVFGAGAKGLGLKTKLGIPSGAFICEYAGEVISLEEAKKRQKLSRLRGEMNFIFVLREFTGDELRSVTCVDPARVGNVGRYINHSCLPNTAIVPVRVNDEVPWLCAFALRDIDPGEEICYDYGAGGSAGGGPRKPCLCAAPHCRKFLPLHDQI